MCKLGRAAPPLPPLSWLFFGRVLMFFFARAAVFHGFFSFMFLFPSRSFSFPLSLPNDTLSIGY